MSTQQDNNDISINNTQVMLINHAPVYGYAAARNEFIKRTIPEVMNHNSYSFELSFTIQNTSSNAHLIYCVIDKIPQTIYEISQNKVRIFTLSEVELITYVDYITDILMIVKSWKSTRITINSILLGTWAEYEYFIDYIFEKNKLTGKRLKRSIIEIKKKYNPSKRKNTPKTTDSPVMISRDNVNKALGTVIDTYLSLYGKNKKVVIYNVSEMDMALAIEDSLIVDFRLLPRYWAQIGEPGYADWVYPYIVIQELTHNELFKFNFTGFKRQFIKDYIGIDFYPFHGLHYYVKEIDNYEVVNRRVPELKLQQRIKQYPGETYHFILFRIDSVEGECRYGAGYTKGKVHTFILKLCKELEEKNSRSLELNGASCLPFAMNCGFISAFLSWKGKKKRWRLENKFSYYYEDKQIKNDSELYNFAQKLINTAYSGKYNNSEFGSYNKPLNRWKSEELVYNITKRLYKDYQVIYQYRPFYLTTDKGSMSYDVYICGLRIAIEYQGKQHFEPVEYFGGVESFKRQKYRDLLKEKISVENGVKLIFVNYWEDITPELIRHKIEGASS